MSVVIVHPRADAGKHRLVQNREMMEVEQVLDDAQVGRRRLVGVFGDCGTGFGGAIEPWDFAKRRALAVPVPDDSVSLANIMRRHVEGRRHLPVDAVAWDEDALAGVIEAKAVVWTLDASLADFSGAEHRTAMRTSIRQAYDAT